MKQSNRHTAPGHGGGPVDNAGKVIKDFLNKQAAFSLSLKAVPRNNKGEKKKRKRTSDVAYNYDTAYEKVVAKVGGYPAPGKEKRRVTGTWGNNGQHFFGVLSNGKDVGGTKKNRRVIRQFGRDVTPVPGSNKLFAFREVRARFCQQPADRISPIFCCFLQKPGQVLLNRQEAVMVQTRFIDCWCPKCRVGKSRKCPYKLHFGEWKDVLMRRVDKKGKIVTQNKGKEACMKCGGTGSFFL